MKNLKIRMILPITLLLFSAEPQVSRADSYKPQRIMSHIRVLAHDSLEGRKVGTQGEKSAAAYISSQFENIRLEPAGDDGSYLQSLDFTAETRAGDNNRLKIGDRELEFLRKTLGGFKPLYGSKSGEFSFESLVYVGFGIEFDSLSHHDYEGKDVSGKAVLISRYSPNGDDPHDTFAAHLSLGSKIAEAIKRDVSAIFFFTPEDIPESFEQRWRANETQRDIPIIFLSRSAFANGISTPEELASQKFSGTVDLVRVKKTGVNVIGLLRGGGDDADERIVVVGAHFDHLGWGGAGSGSLYAGSEKQIHNGADDNASGTAGVIEMARYFKEKQSELDYSILFMAFTGEESGLLGSNYFVKNPTISLEQVRFMFNMDMVGRFDPDDSGLIVLGVGTSPEFKNWFKNYDGKIKVVTSESGVGPSDHTSFYNSNIPALHFMTGLHMDHHKPTDDVEFINPEGEAIVLEFITELLETFATGNEKLEFTRTKDVSPDGSRRYSVTMGIMPDYYTETKGLRIDGVTEDKPANLAGMLSGDIIVKLGEYAVDDIYSYMDALGKFRKGDSTSVIVIREGKQMELPIVF